VAAPRFDLPTPDFDTQPFWDAARARRLIIQHCADCGRHQFYPRPFCAHCWGARVDWVEANGRATLYTYSVVHQNDLPPFPERVPYVAAVVDLDEGPRMMTDVVDCDVEALAVGMPLEVTYRELHEDITVPVFRPAAA